jgi:hypothetical protein
MNPATASRALLLLTLVCPALAQAGTVAYTDSSAFLSAAGAQNTFGFGSAYTATPPDDAIYTTAAGLTVDGVNFAGTLEDIPDYYYLYVTPGTPGLFFDGQPDLEGGFTSFTAGLANPYEYVGDTTLTFPFAVNSVSFEGVLDYGDAGSGAYQVSFSNGDVYDGNNPWTFGTGPQFIGFVSSTPFTSLTITAGAPAADFTDPIFAEDPTLYYLPVLETVSFAATPEPRGLFVVGAIFLCVTRGLQRRRRQSLAATT